MPLEDILLAMQREADETLARIAVDGDRQVEEIMGPARAEAARAAEEVRKARESEACAEAERIRLSARAQAAGRLRDAREEAYARVLELARARLSSIRDRPGYPRVLRSLLEEAIGALPDATGVHVDDRDADLIREDDAVLHERVAVVPGLLTWGGVVATAEGREVRNTLEERLSRADPFLRPIVAEEIPQLATWLPETRP